MEGLSFFTSSIFDIILVFIAIVSVYIGIANSLKSDAIASDANKLARKALDISIFGFKEQISPNLEGNIYIIPNGENSCCIKFSLKNRARGPAIVKQINVKGRKKNIEIEEDIQYPATLLYNCEASIFLRITDLTVEEIQELSGKRGRPFPETLIKVTRQHLGEADFTVDYEDILDTPYRITLTQKLNEFTFSGTPVEQNKS